MGEKRPYKARNPGGGRKKLKPEYNAEKKLKEQLDAAVVLYNSEMSQREIILKLTLYSGYVTLTIYISGKQFFNHSVI